MKYRFLHCGPLTLLIAILIAIVVLFNVYQYNVKNTVTTTVHTVITQQHVSGSEGDIYTSYTYLVTTDQGTFTINPDGLFASKAFGTIKEGKKYTFLTRGKSIPLIGIYPSIIEAKETN